MSSYPLPSVRFLDMNVVGAAEAADRRTGPAT